MYQREFVSFTLAKAYIQISIMATVIGLISILVSSCSQLQTPSTSDQVETEYIGRVVDANTLQPIEGAKISLVVVGVPPIVYTDSEGVYRFRVSISSDISGTVRVDAEGYQVYTRNISLSPDRTSIEDIRLIPLSSEEPPEATLPSPSSEPTIDETEDSLVAITTVQPSSGEWVHADSSQCLWTNATGQGAYIDLTLAGESTVSKLRISLFDPFVRRIRLTFSDNSQQIKDLDEIADYAYQDVSLESVITSSIKVEVLEVQGNAFDNFGICHIEVFGIKPSAGATLSPSPGESNPLADGPDHIDAFGVPMRLVPVGSFMMGSNADKALAECKDFGIDCKREWFINEEPVHEVYLDTYYIDKYEVTNKFYKACVDAGMCDPPIKSWSFTQDDYYGNPEFDDYPVVFVNWDMAETYCEWRGAKLPTEAQWEKAARGTDERIFPWGNDIDYKYANFDQIIRDTTMVSQYEKGKSPYGVYDLAGNTVEWVYDWYSETYYQISPSSNPMGPEPDQGDGRVVRGGSWFDKDQIRSAWREGWEPFNNRDGLGFRCAASANP